MAPKPKEAISTALQQETFASFNMGENWAVLLLLNEAQFQWLRVFKGILDYL